MKNKKQLGNLVDYHRDLTLENLQHYCAGPNEGACFLSGLTHDAIHMLFSIIRRHMSQQEAKTAFKIVIDAALLDYGMSVQIHEFKQ